MKKWMGALLTIMLLLFSVAVSAESVAESQYNAEKSNDVDQYFTTQGTIDGNANGFVTIVVTDTEDITVDSIMYIDQTVADENGAFSFTDYIPKENLNVNEKYIVRIGATGLSAPISGGFLELPVAGGYSVHGNVAFVGEKTPATIQVLDQTGVVKAEIEAHNGTYTIPNVPNGTYTIRFEKISHLPAEQSMTVADADFTAEDVRLLVGDINQDNMIDITDLTNLIEVFGKSESADGFRAAADLNEDGEIGIPDLTAFIENFGKFFQEDQVD